MFVAPHLDTVLNPLVDTSAIARPFLKFVKDGALTVRWSNEFMGQKWRHREGNEELEVVAGHLSQDGEIERLILGGERYNTHAI